MGLSGPRPIRLLAASSLIDFRGNPGIRALYQAIGISKLVANICHDRSISGKRKEHKFEKEKLGP